jgi:hypothetical protein
MFDMQNLLKDVKKKYFLIIAFFIYVILPIGCSKDQPFIEKSESKNKISNDTVDSPELIVDVDINSEVLIRPEPMTEKDVETLVEQLHQNGCTTLLIRAGFLGLLPYRTQLSYPMVFDEDHARIHQCQWMGDINAFIELRLAWSERYAEVIQAIDPIKAFIDAAHSQGMKAIVWIDIFDNFFPGYRSKFLEANPHCQWTARDGITRFRGLVSYAWPEARAFVVAQAQELLVMGADGIHCSTSAHCRHLPNSHKIDFYGYEQPVVDAFKERYGIDLRTVDAFDKEAWHDLKGEFMVSLYHELAQLCHNQDRELWIGLQMGRYTQFTVDPHFSTHAVARYTNLWEQLVDEGIADAFILGDYEQTSDPAGAYWSLKKDIVKEEGEDLYQWAARHYQTHCSGKTRLYLFSEWLPSSLEALEQRLMMFAEVTRRNGFDGIDVHEAMNFEGDPEKMKVLGRFAQRLAGKLRKVGN